MNEIKPKKERRFLKTLGRVGEILVEQVLIKLGSNIIKKIGGKKTLPSILFLFLSLSLFAQFPNTGNKQRLGFQTTGDGLVWRGALSDTASIQPINNQSAWVILDTINLKFYTFDFTSNVWNLVGGAQGLTMPFDSITFNTAKNGTVGVGEVEYNDTQGSLIQGLKGGNVTNVIGQQLHQRVNNRTGAPLAKGDVVYLAGSQGNRITVAKGLAVSDAFSANTFGVVAESIADNQSGFIITEGLITGLNTSALTEDSAVYLSPTVPGALTSIKPQAPQHSVYIGVCVKSNNGSGELFVKIRNGQELDELHDVRISSPVEKSSLYYSGGLWRDTTAALLVSDTASMLTNYLRTGTAASTYLTQSNAASTYLPLTGGTLTGGLTGTSINLSSTLGVTGATTLSSTLGVSGETTLNESLTVNRAGVPLFINSTNSNLNKISLQDNTTVRSYLGAGSTKLFTVANSSVDEKFSISNDGNTNIAGTLGVTGATTLNNGLNITGTTNILNGQPFSTLNIIPAPTIGSTDNTIQTINTTGLSFKIGTTERMKLNSSGLLTVTDAATFNSSAVFNEGAADSDFRVESVGNAHMVFVDASTDRVGIGYASPTKTLDVNGEVRINTVTATPTSLLGKDGSNVVGNVRLTSPLSLAGDSLNLGTVPISKGGTGADNASLARTLLSVGYNFVQVTAGSSVTITSNRVSVVNTGGFSTTQLDLTPATNGRMYMIKNLASGTVVSLHSNVIPLTGGSPTTAILSAGNATPQWVTLVADGTNWHVMQSN